MKKRKSVLKKTYRLFGCRFIEKDFNYINRKLKKIKDKEEISNSMILLELFKLYEEKQN